MLIQFPSTFSDKHEHNQGPIDLHRFNFLSKYKTMNIVLLLDQWLVCSKHCTALPSFHVYMWYTTAEHLPAFGIRAYCRSWILDFFF